jgi:hypothetical protein
LLAGGAGGVEVWDVPSGRLIQSFDWKIGPITALTIHNNGMLAAAGNERGQVVIWDLDD